MPNVASVLGTFDTPTTFTIGFWFYLPSGGTTSATREVFRLHLVNSGNTESHIHVYGDSTNQRISVQYTNGDGAADVADNTAANTWVANYWHYVALRGNINDDTLSLQLYKYDGSVTSVGSAAVSTDFTTTSALPMTPDQFSFFAYPGGTQATFALRSLEYYDSDTVSVLGANGIATNFMPSAYSSSRKAAYWAGDINEWPNHNTQAQDSVNSSAGTVSGTVTNRACVGLPGWL